MGINIKAVEKVLTGLRNLYKSNYVGALKPQNFAAQINLGKVKYKPEFANFSNMSLFKPKAKKILLEKTLRTPIKKYSETAYEIVPQNASEYSITRLGKPNDPNYLQEIVNFYDRDKNLINRFIRESKKDDLFIEYSPWTYSSDVLRGFSRSKTRKITRMAVSRGKAKEDIEIYRGFAITKDNDIPFMPLNNKNAKIISEELQIVKDDVPRFDLMKDRYIKHCYHRGFRLDKGEIIERNPDEIFKPKPNRIESTVIKRTYGKSQEIPEHISLKTHSLSNNLGEINIEKSSADLYLKKEAKDVKLTNFESYNSDKYAAIADNPFAAYMYLRPKAKGKYLERFFAKRKGILPLNVKTYVNSSEVAKNAGGHFSPWNCQIHTKKGYNRPSIYAHENEHVFQYSLEGQYLLNSGMVESATTTGKRAAKLFGGCEPNLMAEGEKYHIARINYPILSPTENLRNNPLYMLNDLEEGARKAEKKWVQYDYLPHTETMSEINF